LPTPAFTPVFWCFKDIENHESGENPVWNIFKDRQNHESGVRNRNLPKNCMQWIVFRFKDMAWGGQIDTISSMLN